MNAASDTQGNAIQAITVGDAIVSIGRNRDATVCLSDPTISRKHASVRRVDGGYVIEDHDSTYGTFVNGNRIRVALVRSGDRVQFGTTIFFRVNEIGLVPEETPKGVALTAEDLSITREGRVLVHDASFRIPADAFVGILGPSGVGKSTLLNCIATYLSPGKGRVLFDNDDAVTHQDACRAVLAHVPQADVVHPSLTVRENVTFAARLRLGGETQTPDLNREVERVLRLVSLAEKANEPVAKLSGGERKRVSVAMELVRRPRLLLLDEPTSGLDPATEAHLMEQLRHISHQGTTVVCTTHMMENIWLFDSLIVLGRQNDQGHIAYAGPPGDLLAHFSCKTLADLYESLADGRFVPIADEPSQRDTASTQLDQRPLPTSMQAIKLVVPDSSSVAIPSSRRLRTKQLAPRLSDTTAQNQLAMLCQRARLLTQRDRQLIVSLVVQPILLGLLACWTQYNASRLVPLLFFVIVITIWLGLNNSARDLVRERSNYIRDRLAGLRPGVYLSSKVLVHGVIGAAQIILLLLVVSFVAVTLLEVTGQKPQADDLRHTSFLWLFLVLSLCYLGALGMGLMLSALARTQEFAVAVLPLLIMPQLLISVVGTLQIEEVYCSRREPRPFRPLMAKLTAEESLPRTEGVLDLASLLCLTRPAVLLAAKPMPTVPDGLGRMFWVADFLHLLILVQLIWVFTWLAFTRAEQQWARLIGVG